MIYGKSSLLFSSLPARSQASSAAPSPTGSFHRCQSNDRTRKDEADHAESIGRSPARSLSHCPSLVVPPARWKSPRLPKSTPPVFQNHPASRETTTHPWFHACVAKDD